MDESMKSNLSLGLLGLIAVLTIYNTFIKEDKVYTRGAAAQAAAAPNLVAPPSQNQVNNNPYSAQTTLNTNEQAQTQTAQQAPQQPSMPPTQISFAQAQHDFGTIKQNTQNKHVFTFTNTGDEPLLINNAKGSCGCTVPKYPKEPIAPGAQGEIEVVYSPGTQKGNQVKTVSITANTEPAVTTLQIKAMVEETEG